jgi:hypothetical protein
MGQQVLSPFPHHYLNIIHQLADRAAADVQRPPFPFQRSHYSFVLQIAEHGVGNFVVDQTSMGKN